MARFSSLQIEQCRGGAAVVFAQRLAQRRTETDDLAVAVHQDDVWCQRRAQKWGMVRLLSSDAGRLHR